MKKNWALRLASMALVLSLVTMSLVSGTFAKYAQAVTGDDVARAARFAFDIRDGVTVLADETSSTATFSIFDYTDTGVWNNGVNGTDKFIAPGTTGTFDLAVDNLSEVDVTLALDLTETNDGDIPVYYTIGAGTQRYSSVLTGSYGAESYQDLTQLAAALSSATLQASDGATPTTATFTLNWAWAFETAGTGQSDTTDTAIGTAATLPTVQLTVDATVTQVD